MVCSGAARLGNGHNGISRDQGDGMNWDQLTTIEPRTIEHYRTTGPSDRQTFASDQVCWSGAGFIIGSSSRLITILGP